MTSSAFAAPGNERFFEDYVPGSSFEFGTVQLTEAEMLDFARKFDPQDFHTDPEKAAHGPFGGLIASGWHTAGAMMSLYAKHYLSKVSSLGSPGIDEVRWTRPVRPGDSLSVRVNILEANRSRSKPDRGIVRTLVEVLNQNREVVMSFKAINLIRCRELA
jgi:acyl dehydratase